MKVTVLPQTRTRRGGEVKVGNVYTNPHGRPVYKIVVGVMEHQKPGSLRVPFNNVVLIKVTSDGTVVGAGCEPEAYVRDHQDLVGVVKQMPELTVEFLPDDV